MYPNPGYGYPGMIPTTPPGGMVFVMTPQGMMSVPAEMVYNQYNMMAAQPQMTGATTTGTVAPTVAATPIMPVGGQFPTPAAPVPAGADDDWGDFQQSDGPHPRGIGS